MADLKLFRTVGGQVQQMQPSAAVLEKHLQNLIERNLEAFFGVRFLASEYNTSNGGRMDTLGIDENGFPVIIEHKRNKSENVINQGLFYLDWLMDHRDSFAMEVMKRDGAAAAEAIDWSAPRLICIAEDFTKYDEHAVRQMNRNIELVRYRRYGDELLLFELVNVVETKQAPPSTAPGKPGGKEKTVDQLIEMADAELRERYDTLRNCLLALGDDVQEKLTKFYVAFRRLKNFACVEVHPQSRAILVYVKVDPDSVALKDGFTRDVRGIGHFGTGDLEIRIESDEDLESAYALIDTSYEVS